MQRLTRWRGRRWRSLQSFVAASCAFAALAVLLPARAFSQEMGELPAMESEGFEEGPPISEMGGGSFFSQELGTLLRLRYNTESYGQDRRGNLDIGTMQVANFEDSIAFFDGQATLSDVNGVGYNLGVGFRWLGWTPFMLEPERITGFNFWADGSSTESGNFFPQVGVGFESLGEMWDLRVNGYIPVGQESQIGEFRPTGGISFDDHFLVQEALADRNTSFNVGEAEIARRIMSDRDAWAFAGPYVLVNDEQDSAGYRVGFRGYAYPDLLVQLAVTDDDIFKTRAAFSVTWFVGRTRTNFQPACGLADRMREPVMRNDYVALQRTTEVGGEPLTAPNGDLIRFVHVDSDAAAGGNGTFEHPLNNVGNVESNSINGDIVLLWAASVFSGQNTLQLQDNQRLLGEGNGEFFTVNTSQQGVVVIPETSPGARDLARPQINGAQGLGAVRLADTNEVANFNINGTGSSAGAAGIFSPMAGAGNPNIHDIDMSNVSGAGIQFTPLSRNNTNNAFKTIAGNVTINDVNFNNMGDVEIDIDSESADASNVNNTLQETIAINNVNSQNGSAEGVRLRNTHDNHTATITNYTNGTAGTAGSGGGALATGVLVFQGSAVDQFDGDVTLTNIHIVNNQGYALDFANIDPTSATTITSGNGLTWDGGAGTAGGMRFDTFNGSITGNSSTLTGGTLDGIRVRGDSDGTFTFANTVTITNVDGAAIDIDGNVAGANLFTGAFTFSGDITNDMGRSVSIQGISDAGTSVTIGGDIGETSASQGIFVNDNSGGTILFSGDITQNLTGVNGITLTSNTGTDINFGGVIDTTTTGAGKAFTATGGGSLSVTNTGNKLRTGANRALEITGMTINAAGANFSEVNVTGSVDNGIVLQDNLTGPITVGTLNDPVGDSGTITNTAGTAIVIQNSANVTISSLIVDVPGQTGVSVTKTTTGTQTVNLNDLQIGNETTAGSTVAIDVIGDGGASDTLNMTVNDVAINNATQFGMRFNDIDSGTIQVNGTTIDGDTASAGAQGVLIMNSNANITFDAASKIQEFQATDFEVDGGSPAVTFNGGIVNNAGRSILIENIAGGSVSFGAASTLDDNAMGMLVQNNTAGTISFNGAMDFDTTTNTAVALTNNTGATINFLPPGASPLDINTTTGNGFVATGGGTLTVAGSSNKITTTTGRGLDIEGMTIGAVDFESVNVNGADNGIRLVNNTAGTITVGDTGAAVGAGGTIQNTTDAGVHVENSNFALNGVTVQNAGNAAGENGVEVFHTNATTMNASLNTLTVTNATAARDGVVIDGVGGSGTFNANIQNLNVNVTGDGLNVANGVTLTAGGTNTITSATGVGLSVTDSTIAAAGANFQSVNVTGGATSGILLSNLTGGQIAVTGTGTTTNSGGSLTTTGTAIEVTNVANADLNNVRIVNSAVGMDINHTNAATSAMDLTINNLNLDNATGHGIDLSADNDAFTFALRLNNSDIANADVLMDVTGAGHFGLLVDNTNISTGAGAVGRAFDLQIHDGATAADLTFQNGNNFTADDGEALFIDSFDAPAKNVKLLVQDSTFTDSTGTELAADIRSRGTTIFQATIQGNTFSAASAAHDMVVQSSGTASSQMRLNLGGDVTDPADFNSAVGQGTLFVSQAGTSVFSIFQRDDTFLNLRNNDPVDHTGTFQNLATTPALPVIP